MPILLLILGYFFPRLIIFLLYIFTGWWSAAFHSIIWPLLGFFFMPVTTLWYGVSETYFGDDAQTIGLVVAVLADLGLIGRGAKGKK
jgi:hypothetical protein